MKFICNKLNIHFNTSSQLNGDWKNVKMEIKNLLRGAKALGDKLDIGLITSNKDLEMLQFYLGFYNLHIYTRGKFKVKIGYIDLTCRSLFLIGNFLETTVEKILND